MTTMGLEGYYFCWRRAKPIRLCATHWLLRGRCLGLLLHTEESSSSKSKEVLGGGRFVRVTDAAKSWG